MSEVTPFANPTDVDMTSADALAAIERKHGPRRVEGRQDAANRQPPTAKADEGGNS